MKSMTTAVAAMLIVIGIGSTVVLGAVPYLTSELMVKTRMEVGTDMGASNDVYNCRRYGGNNYIPQRTIGFARYPAGSDVIDAYHTNILQMRMAAPFDGGTSTTYVLAGAGSNNGYFTRLDYANLDNPVYSTTPSGGGGTGDGYEPQTFDWVDNDTVIFTSYENRANLYLADVVADPFTVTINTTWSTSASRIRSVRKGDAYSEYAYYGEAGVDIGANFCAINLATGAETVLGTLGTAVDPLGGSGLWTVQEAGGYLYIHTYQNGIYVYNMTDATTVGTLFTHHTNADLNELVRGIATANPNTGIDILDGGATILLGMDEGLAVELIPEPATFTLIALGGLGLLKRRRRK